MSRGGTDTAVVATELSPTAIRLFSAGWYLDANPDVRASGGAPLEHYLRCGWREGRDPHPLFDSAWYMCQAMALTGQDAETVGEPLTHYLSHGWKSLLSPHPLFDPARYLLQYTDIMAADVDPWLHYIDRGWKEGRNLHPLFDIDWYLDANPDVRASGDEPLKHYLSHGWREGRSPHPVFDPVWYRKVYADIAGIDPWQHYFLIGWQEGRSPHPLFDATWYQRQYLDPVAQDCEPLTHYLSHGWKEGLAPNATPPKDLGTADPETDRHAPLYTYLTTPRPSADDQTATRGGTSADGQSGFETDGRRGRLLLVTHDTQLGGAQTVLRLFAQWLISSTRFSVGIVAVKDGHFRYAFEELAPTFVLSDHAEVDRAGALAAWAGEDVQAIFLNSIASGSFFEAWPEDTPSVAFIHELPKILTHYRHEVALVRDRAHHVIGGGPDVTTALRDQFGYDPEALTSSHSFVEKAPDDGDPEVAQERRAAARAALEVADDRFLVMGCGVLHWRKSPDKFIEAAERLLNDGLEADFVWLGGGPDQEACEAMVREKGLEGRVRFIGYEPEVAARLAGADLFLLSSQEDPFPLVALYAAQAGVPIVCFEDAGGIADFVRTGSGTAVPFMDVGAMVAAVARYAGDRDLRSRTGTIGRDQVARAHTIETAGPNLLHHLRTVAGLAPEVSVVLPNYNYEAYLPQRLDSIAAQRFQDFEVILLDDASPDRSAAVLEDFAALRAGTRVVINTENSGSPFRQWMRGMALAQSEIVWLAEADDYCEPELLDTLLPLFDDRNLRIASCASVPVQADGTLIGDYRPIYLDRITPGRWDADFISTDHEEANDGLGIANTIPNASAVMFRRFTPDPAFVEEVTSMRLCGDWYFYVRTMRGGLVGFSARPLNYHRRHDSTVTHQLEGSLRYFSELATVRTYLGRHYRQDRSATDRIGGFLAQDIARFNVTEPETLAVPEPAGKLLPSLLVVAPDLSPGGGQIFAISLANEWVRRGGRAVLLNVGQYPTHPAVITKIDSTVTLLTLGAPGGSVEEIVARYDIDVIHSSIWWADVTVDAAMDRLPPDLPWIITMHGCHETILGNRGIDSAFTHRLARMKARASAWVYTADKNLAVFDMHGRPDRLLRIPNGMPEEPEQAALDKAGLGLRPEAVVLCLASRAIPSKGWFEAVALTQALNAAGHTVDLMLIGEGPAADEIRDQAPHHVHLMGQVSNLQDYLAVADIGLLPSYFVGESLPLVLLEMMAKGLPVLTSTIGEIPGIVGTGDDAAGLMVALQGEGIDSAALIAAGTRLMEVDLRARLGRNARVRFDADFRLDRMVNRYAILYVEVGALSKGP
jgi:glycosyltransferase involved in cell wall biosynthesis